MSTIPLWAKILAVLAVIAALLVGFNAYNAHVFKQGYDKADGEAKAREAVTTATSEKRLADATKAALDREHALQAALDAADAKRYEENQNHEKEIAALRARARAGDERLRVAVDVGSLQRCAASANPAAAAGPGDGQRADLVPGTADALFGIAGRIADLVRRYDAIVDQYDRARETCNAVTP